MASSDYITSIMTIVSQYGHAEAPGIGGPKLACDIEERGHVTWRGVEDRGM